jgi:hypothetical protein
MRATSKGKGRPERDNYVSSSATEIVGSATTVGARCERISAVQATKEAARPTNQV